MSNYRIIGTCDSRNYDCRFCEDYKTYWKENCSHCPGYIKKEKALEISLEMRRFAKEFDKSTWGELTYDNPLITELLEYLKELDI